MHLNIYLTFYLLVFLFYVLINMLKKHHLNYYYQEKQSDYINHYLYQYRITKFNCTLLIVYFVA